MAFVPGAETHPLSDAVSVSNNKVFNVVQVADPAGNIIDPSGGGGVVLDGLSIPAHDYIGLSYTGSNLTGVTYKTGGSGGTTVATLVLAYDGSNNLTSITKS